MVQVTVIEMSTAKKCDICNEYYDITGDNRSIIMSGIEYDICAECYDHIRRALSYRCNNRKTAAALDIPEYDPEYDY